MTRLILVLVLALVPAVASAQAPYQNPPPASSLAPMVVFPGSANSVQAVDGAATAPSISFASHPTTGWYWASSDNIIGTQAGTAAILINNNLVRLNSNTTLGWSSGNVVGAAEDTTLTRSAAGTLSLTGTTPMIQLGGTTSSFPALKRGGSSLQSRFADDSGYADFAAKNFFVGASLLIGANAPTISSGFGTSPSVASNNGAAAFTVNVGTGGAASAGVIGLPTATTGWNCWVRNLTAQAANRADQDTRQTASTTTTATVQNQTVSTGAALVWAASDILRVSCFAY